jgi:hypothetical protein
VWPCEKGWWVITPCCKVMLLRYFFDIDTHHDFILFNWRIRSPICYDTRRFILCTFWIRLNQTIMRYAMILADSFYVHFEYVWIKQQCDMLWYSLIHFMYILNTFESSNMHWTWIIHSKYTSTKLSKDLWLNGQLAYYISLVLYVLKTSNIKIYYI